MHLVSYITLAVNVSNSPGPKTPVSVRRHIRINISVTFMVTYLLPCAVLGLSCGLLVFLCHAGVVDVGVFLCDVGVVVVSVFLCHASVVV